jgi:hypothetical protein
VSWHDVAVPEIWQITLVAISAPYGPAISVAVTV